MFQLQKDDDPKGQYKSRKKLRDSHGKRVWPRPPSPPLEPDKGGDGKSDKGSKGGND